MPIVLLFTQLTFFGSSQAFATELQKMEVDLLSEKPFGRSSSWLGSVVWMVSSRYAFQTDSAVKWSLTTHNFVILTSTSKTDWS